MEWVSVLTRSENLPPGISREKTLGFLRRLLSLSHLQQIHYLWRPFLPDPDDDMVLELAFAADCKYIVTHNLADFRGSDKLGIAAVSPGDFLEQLKKRT
jgi:predicted nucleic acid-binding protein